MKVLYLNAMVKCMVTCTIFSIFRGSAEHFQKVFCLKENCFLIPKFLIFLTPTSSLRMSISLLSAPQNI